MDLFKGYASNSNSSEEADFVGRSGVADERETDMVAVNTPGELIYFPRSNCYVGAKSFAPCRRCFVELVLVGNECFWE